VVWLQPIPDALAGPASDNPAAVVERRTDLRLALIAGLQHLPPRQRAVLILRDVLGWPAAEVAEALEISTAAVKSVLQRARARIREVAPAPEDAAEPTAPEVRSLLDTYMAAFESSDVRVLERVLRADAAIEMAPSPTWFSGLATCVRFLAASGAMGAAGDWRMLPTSANGQPAAAAYLRGSAGVHRAYGVALLTTSASRIARITVFAEPRLVERFGFPPSLPSQLVRG
jgi:RNA polymerase sigma-70 factor (ECF subfamily)